MTRYIFSLLSMIIISALIIGCSGTGQDPITPSESCSDDLASVIMPVDPSATNRHFMGSWTVNFDVDNMTSTIKPNRTLDAHYNVTNLLPPPGITINSWNPAEQIIDVDVSIHNSHSINVYDVRLIIYTSWAGHMLVNRDNWTDLYDIAGGLPINPFKAYAKSEPNRLFAGNTTHNENLLIKCPGGNFNIQFAIDASFPSNCEEPYEISGFSMGTLTEDSGSSTQAAVTVLSWQDNVNSVQLHAPLITGSQLVNFQRGSGDTWLLNLENATGRTAGEYLGYILATTEASGGLALYDQVRIVISESGFRGWARHWGDTENDTGRAIASDSSGNVIVGGDFEGYLVDFDPGPDGEFYSSNGNKDAFINKFDSDGNQLWARTWGAWGNNSVLGLAFDAMDSVLVTGKFLGTVDFDPGPGETIYIAEGEGVDTTSIYVSKFASNGDFVFAKAWGGYEKDAGLDCAIDGGGNFYVTGYFSDTVDFNPDFGVNLITSNGGTDAFLSKFGAGGDFLWARAWGGDENLLIDMGKSVTTDNANSVYVVGEFEGTVDFKPGTGVDERTASGMQDIYLIKHSWTGAYQWVKTWGGTTMSDADTANKVLFDGSSRLYIVGEFGGTVDFDPGPGTVQYTSAGGKDVYLSCFDLDGNLIWAIAWGGSDDDYGYSLDIDSNGNIYVGGAFKSTDIDFDPGQDSHIVPSVGGNDFYISKFDSDGNFQWVRTWGGSEDDRGFGVTVDNDDMVYLTGDFQNSVDFNPTAGEYILESKGMRDAFLLRLRPDGGW